MPRMTQEEWEADLAAARVEGFMAARVLVGSLAKVGLSLQGMAGALEGHAAEMTDAAAGLRRKAEEARPAVPPAE